MIAGHRPDRPARSARPAAAVSPPFRAPDHGYRRVTSRAVHAAAWIALLAGPASPDEVQLRDGRVLAGRFTYLPSVLVDPLQAARQAAEAGNTILVCDDELTRTMVARRQVVKVEEGPVDLGLERIRIQQNVPEKGRAVIGIGGAIRATPFDEFGRRILSLDTAGGRVDVVQGITEITPRWTRIQSIVTEQPILLDMRLATNIIPREELRRVIVQGTARTNSDERLRVVRLLIQGERYDEARRELDEVLRDFPELSGIVDQRRKLAEFSARQILAELSLRGRSGQDRLAMRLLDAFPIDNLGGETLEAIREARDRYQERQTQAQRLVARLEERVAGIEDEVSRRTAAEVVAEIREQLTFATVERLATFEQLSADAGAPADRLVAIAIGGWLLGVGGGTENLKLSLSAFRLRGLIRDYLRAAEQANRDELFARMREQEAFEPATVAAIAAHMRPPLDAPAAVSPGLHSLTLSGLPHGDTAACLVQLPPEYDPLRRYPAVVALHAAGMTPLSQVEWWAGMPARDGSRAGQATRHGVIVIAPAWTRPDQVGYEYSAREHAVVLGAVRESCRRFAIDTDRVFIAGHAQGGNAAWDIALAHPDTWAGMVGISATADKYVRFSMKNARRLPLYLVGGELDGGTLKRNAVELDEYFERSGPAGSPEDFDVTYVEYRGRGHEHFADEQLRIFDWLGRKKRSLFPQKIEAVSLRPWDRFFWWVEYDGPPERTVVLPAMWPPVKGTTAFEVEAKTLTAKPGNIVSVQCGAQSVRIWLSPELIDFSLPTTVKLAGTKLFSGQVIPDLRVMLEDLRLRADRQHPFWTVVEKKPAAAGRGRD
jgi:predicted esterase